MKHNLAIAFAAPGNTSKLPAGQKSRLSVTVVCNGATLMRLTNLEANCNLGIPSDLAIAVTATAFNSSAQHLLEIFFSPLYGQNSGYTIPASKSKES